MLTKLIQTETSLFIREKAGAAIVVCLPLLLVAGFGLIPGFREPDKDLGGQSGTEFIASMGVALGLFMLGVQVLPGTLATNREKGILRRLQVTPVGPGRVLGVQLLIYTVTGIFTGVVVVLFTTLVYGQSAPRSLGWFVVSFVLAMGALFAIGLLIGAVAPTAKAGTGIALLVFFPSLFLGGVWFPYEAMPAAMQRISDFTPLGAGLEVLRHSWQGTDVGLLHLGVLAGWTLIASVAAARFFSWE